MNARAGAAAGWRSVMGHPQVGIDHFLVVAHLVRRAVPDLLAVVHHDHPVGQVHHHAHVMLDQHDGGAEFVVHVEDETAHVLFLFDVHARHRLVQQQDLRLGGQCTGQFDTLLQAVRQAAHGRLADRLNLQEINDFLNLRAVGDLFLLGAAPPHRLTQQAGLHVVEPPGHDVVENAHAFEQGDVLERPRDALPGYLVGLHRRALLAAIHHFALLRIVEPADDVQHRGLARPVWPDDRTDLAFAHVERDILDRLHTAETQRDRAHFQHHGANLAAIGGHVTFCCTIEHSGLLLSSGPSGMEGEAKGRARASLRSKPAHHSAAIWP
mmetsp:Transcript_2863/g.4911  ORF Transcript_2863/g.4911 Transcript_2863/m.4911 type:complete len:324 (+) Transcript_2863:201-1172(+)